MNRHVLRVFAVRRCRARAGPRRLLLRRRRRRPRLGRGVGLGLGFRLRVRLRPVRATTSPAASRTTRYVQQAVEDYETYVTEQIDQLLTDTKVFTDAVRAGDLEAAKAAYAPVPGQLGAHRADRRPGRGRSTARSTPGSTTSRTRRTRRSPAGTASSTSCGSRTPPTARAEFADKLDEDLATLKTEIADVEITPLAVTAGLGRAHRGGVRGQDHR